MKNILFFLIFVQSLSFNLQVNSVENNNWSQINKRVLIFTKNGLSVDGKKGYVHKNIANSIKALGEICEAENISFDNSEDSSVFNQLSLSKYDAIIFSNS